MKTIVVLQPGYLPWLGFFDQLKRCDTFVYYDDVQFDKHGWRNRNRIKTPQGPHWLTVPVHHKGKPTILEVEIDGRGPWAKKHLETIRQFYAKAPHFEPYYSELSEVLNRPWKFLVDLDLAVVELICRWLGLQRTILRSSELGISGESSRRLVDICLHLGADRYLTGDAAKSYLDEPIFARHGISVEWQNYQHPVYPQLHGPFLPYLSALDLIFNTGVESRMVLGLESVKVNS